ncbi:MAG: acyltransferase [Thermoplasmatota archaeon]
MSGDPAGDRKLIREELYNARGWKISPVLRLSIYITWLPLFIIAILILTASLIAPVFLVRWVLGIYDGATGIMFFDLVILSASIGASYIIFGLGLLLFGGMLKRVLDPFFGLKEGEYPFISTTSGYWSVVNGIILFNRQFFLELTRTTFLVIMFYRLLGMKIGKGTLINSSFIYDPDFVSIGRNVTIGGDALILGHVGERGVLKLKNTIIEDNVDIGQSAVVLSGVRIGKGSVIGALSIVTKDTVIPPYEIWAGIPARRIGRLRPPSTRS